MAYEPGQPPVVSDELEAIASYVYEELQKLAAAYNEYGAGGYPVRNAEPARPRDGMVERADGTNWNPGSGEGLYAYYNSTWNKL